ncbi:MAG: hypothetical protein AVDCRST_MAG75-792 [uncultured Propionibacteriaceae bacterium]|uniref:Uncharacterized protein n=1 Tax=uncultured Propionibacteriaceae bacterium TaxID=257457 RepID=A0A6J4N6A6_9ACTN|nr:MAG: hypothetical protein AVDCRST_MAG75-792 [uncultured Propionibacteriaceae bacterium]
MATMTAGPPPGTKPSARITTGSSDLHCDILGGLKRASVATVARVHEGYRN